MEKPHANLGHESEAAPLRIYYVKTLTLDYWTLQGCRPQENGHPTEGYKLALLTKDPEKEFGLIHQALEPDAEGNYDLESVPDKSILKWTPLNGGEPEYGAVIECRPFELNYVEADSPEHAWEILA